MTSILGSHNSISIARSPVAIAEYTARSLSTFSSDIARQYPAPCPYDLYLGRVLEMR